MINSRQQAYLAAMDIGVWCLRDSPISEAAVAGVAPELRLSPGNSGILLVCPFDSDAASRLANDIGRALGVVPVWAWPQTATGTTLLADAVDERLFTTVAIFGNELAQQMFCGDVPERLNSATVVLLPSMGDIENRSEARLELWSIFCRFGMVNAGVTA